MAMNMYSTIEELLDASFSARSMLCRKKVGYYYFPELLVIVIPSVSFSIWETKRNHKGLSLASRKDGEQ
jgi:hypothetical protein